jgi:hypothetical protein
MIRNATNYDVLNAGLSLMLFNVSLFGINLSKYGDSNDIFRILYFSGAVFSTYFMFKLGD